MGDQKSNAMGSLIWRRALLSMSAVALTLLVIELSVDRFFPVLGQVYQLDSTLLHDAIPGSRRIQPMEPSRLGPGDRARVLVEVGPGGFRGDLDLDRDRESTARLLVLGDSFVMAENVPLEGTFVRQLAFELERGLGCEVEGVNAGRSGYGPDQSLLLLEREIDTVAPDVIVCVLCAHNDVGDLARNKLLRLGPDGGLVRCQPRIGARLVDEFARRAERSGGLGIQRLVRFWQEAPDRAPVNSVPAGTMDLYLAALAAQYDEFFVRNDLEVVSLFEDVYDADVAIRPETPAVSAKLELMAAVLRSMVELAASRGVPLHFVIVPSAVDMCPGFGIQVDPDRFSGYSPDHLSGRLVEAVELAGGRLTDLSAQLRAEGGEVWVGGTDIHWNAAGQRVGARSVAAALLERPDLQSRLGVGGADSLDAGPNDADTREESLPAADSSR